MGRFKIQQHVIFPFLTTLSPYLELVTQQILHVETFVAITYTVHMQIHHDGSFTVFQGLVCFSEFFLVLPCTLMQFCFDALFCPHFRVENSDHGGPWPCRTIPHTSYDLEILPYSFHSLDLVFCWENILLLLFSSVFGDYILLSKWGNKGLRLFSSLLIYNVWSDGQSSWDLWVVYCGV